MYEKKVKIKSEAGLLSRSAFSFVEKALSFSGDEVYVESCSRRANAKSLIGILSLGVHCGDYIKVISTSCKAAHSLASFLEEDYHG